MNLAARSAWRTFGGNGFYGEHQAIEFKGDRFEHLADRTEREQCATDSRIRPPGESTTFAQAVVRRVIWAALNIKRVTGRACPSTPTPRLDRAISIQVLLCAAELETLASTPMRPDREVTFQGTAETT